jgi:holo-[acyl-carrier protein] synthase
MTITVGTDLIEIARVQDAVASRAPRLAQRLFTPQEWAYCQSRRDPYRSLAARFAAKEAIRKIFGQWGYPDVVWRETEIVAGPHGAPIVALHGKAKERAQNMKMSISLSHTDTHAQAFCVAYGEP